MLSVTQEKAETRLQECANVINATVDGSKYARENNESKVSIIENNIRYIDHSKNIYSHYDIDYSEADLAKQNGLNYISSINA